MEVRILRDGEDTGYKYLSCRLSATVDLVSQRCDLYLSRDSSFAVGQELGIEGDGVRLFSAPVVKVGPGRHSQLRIIAFAKLDEVVHVNYHQEDAANILSDIIERHNYKSTGKRMDFALRGERMSLLHHWLDTVAPGKEAFMDAEGVLQVGLEPGSRVHLGKLIEEHGDWQEYRAVPVLLGQVSSQGIVRRLEYALKPTRERLRIWWGELKGKAKESEGMEFDAVTSPAPEAALLYLNYQLLDHSSKIEYYHTYIYIFGSNGREYCWRGHAVGGRNVDVSILTEQAASPGVSGGSQVDLSGSQIELSDSQIMGKLQVVTGQDAKDTEFENLQGPEAEQYLGPLPINFIEAVNKLEAYARRINAAQLNYNLLARNSNTAAFRAAELLLGKSPKPLNEKWVPGYNRDLF